MAGRLSEASELRFQGEQTMVDGKLEEATRQLAKAVQLDPGDAYGHVLYARVLTKSFYANKGPVDEDLLKRCISEWKLIWHHDADAGEQSEAKWQVWRLYRLSRALDKRKRQESKALLAEQKGKR